MPQDGDTQAGTLQASAPDSTVELRKRLADIDGIRASVDDATKLVRGVFLAVLLLGLYIVATVFATQDIQLLKGGTLQLPLVNARLSILGFYLIAPGLMLLLHLNLLLQLQFLSQKLKLFDRALASVATGDSELVRAVDRAERVRLFPFPFNALYIGQVPGLGLRIALAAFVWSTSLFFAQLVLWIVLIRFLAYHSEFFSWYHRLLIILDVALIWSIWPSIMSNGGTKHWWRAFRARYCSRFRIRYWLIGSRVRRKRWNELVAQVVGYPRGHWPLPHLTAWCIIVLWIGSFPGGSLDNAKRCIMPNLFGLKDINTGYHRHQRISIDLLTWLAFGYHDPLLERRLVVRNAVISANDVKWEKVEELREAPNSKAPRRYFQPIDLASRNFDYADFSESFFVNTILNYATFRGAELLKTSFQNASLRNANLINAYLRQARLNAAHLQGAKLCGAVLHGAMVDDADFAQAVVQHNEVSDLDMRKSRNAQILKVPVGNARALRLCRHY